MNRAVATGSPLASLQQTATAPSVARVSDGFALAVDAVLGSPAGPMGAGAPVAAASIEPVAATSPQFVVPLTDMGKPGEIIPLPAAPKPDAAPRPAAANRAVTLAGVSSGTTRGEPLPKAILSASSSPEGDLVVPAGSDRSSAALPVAEAGAISSATEGHLAPEPAPIAAIVLETPLPVRGSIDVATNDQTPAALPRVAEPPEAVPTSEAAELAETSALPGMLAAQLVAPARPQSREHAAQPRDNGPAPSTLPPLPLGGDVSPTAIRPLPIAPAGIPPAIAAPLAAGAPVWAYATAQIDPAPRATAAADTTAPIQRSSSGERPKAEPTLSSTVSPDTIATAIAAPVTTVASAPLNPSDGKQGESANRDPAPDATRKPAIDVAAGGGDPAAAAPSAIAIANAAVLAAPVLDRLIVAPPIRADTKRDTVSGKAAIQASAAPATTTGPAAPNTAPPRGLFAALATEAAALPTDEINSKTSPGDGGAPNILAAAPVAMTPNPPPNPAHDPSLHTATPLDMAAPLAKAPAAPAMAEPVVVARPGQIGQDLGVAIAHRLSVGGEELIVRLVPAELGRIEVRMSFDERGGLRAVIAADSPVALDMLRRDSADLSRSLSDAGVRSDAQSLRFQTDSGSGGANSQQRSPWLDADNRSGRAARDTGLPEDAEPAAYRSIRTSGSYNLLA